MLHTKNLKTWFILTDKVDPDNNIKQTSKNKFIRKHMCLMLHLCYAETMQWRKLCGDALTKNIMHNFSSFFKHCDPESENLTHKS